MPFYIAQIAPHTYVNLQGALLRESQDYVAATEPGCELVVTNDSQEIPGDVHPRLKKNVCHRFALCALGHHYKKDVGPWRSPAYERVDVEGSEVKVSFKNLPTVLQVRGEQIIGFQIGEKKPDGTVRYVLADARLDESGKNVILTSDQINNPSDVRYCFDESVGNVFSAEGLPLAPFRTDTSNKPLSKSARAYIEPATKTSIIFEGEGYQKVTFEEGAKFWTDSEMTLFEGSYPMQFEGFEMLISNGVTKGEHSKGGKIIAKEDGRIYFISALAKDLKKNWYKPGWRVIMPSEIQLSRVIGNNSDGTPKYKTVGSIYISYLDVKAGQEVELPVTTNWSSVIPLASSIEYKE
jgi:sialate O-acetylesterase